MQRLLRLLNSRRKPDIIELRAMRYTTISDYCFWSWTYHHFD